MKLIKSFLCCVLLLLSVISVKAQGDPVRIGFGVGFGREFTSVFVYGGIQELSVITLPVEFVDLSVTIRSKNFLFEPTFGYSSTSRSYTSSSSDYSSDLNTSNLRLGTVLAYVNTNESLNYYYGIDLGVFLNSESLEINDNGITETRDKSKTDFFIGPAIGGEYMFSNNFSLGGEIQVNYIWIGNFNDDSNISSSAISSRGKIIIRWYVN
jgi:hypothetical protein